VTVSIQAGLAEEIARDYGLDTERLQGALVQAAQAHHDVQNFWLWRERSTGQLADIEPTLAAVQRALRLWSEVPAELHRDVAFFQDPSDQSDPVGPKLRFVAELLEEYRDHYRRPRGNPGRSRTGQAANDLDPLKAFCAVLIDFWSIEKGMPFGHGVERQYDLDGVDLSDDKSAPRAAESLAMRFLEHAGVALHPINYTISNFETVVRQIKRNPHLL